MPETNGTLEIRLRIEKAITELVNLNHIVGSCQVEPQILADFRDTLNRVRNTAWAAQQYMIRKENQQDISDMRSFLAGERIRAAYHLCCLIKDDLGQNEVELQAGTLIQLHEATKAFTQQLEGRINRLG